MLWCEFCECEYEDYVEICVDCGQTLVQKENIPQEEAVYEDYQLLTTCNNNDEVKLLVSFLESYNIKTAIQYEGSGSYLNILHGFNYQGANILVPSKEINGAKEVLVEFKYSHKVNTGEYESEVLIKYYRRRKIVAYLIMFAFLSQFLIYRIIEAIIQ